MLAVQITLLFAFGVSQVVLPAAAEVDHIPDTEFCDTSRRYICACGQHDESKAEASIGNANLADCEVLLNKEEVWKQKWVTRTTPAIVWLIPP